MKPIPLLLDTDIGDDIDDALALAVLLNSPEIALRAVTTVFVNAPRRALLARHLLQLWQRDDVAIGAGCSKPLLQSFSPQIGAQFQVLEADVWDEAPPHALDVILDSIDWNEEPDEENRLTILAIGPLTNIALALVREPELAARARLVLMGGNAPESKDAEWNFKNDPEAAAMVFQSGIEITQIHYGITSCVQLNDSHLQQIADDSRERLQVLSHLIELWRGDKKTAVRLHDPLAALTLFCDCVRFEEMNAHIELCGEKRGVVQYDSGEPCRVSVAADEGRAVQEFMNRLMK